MTVTRTPVPALDRQLDELERDLGLTHNELAHVLGIGPELLVRWQTGEATPYGEAQQRLRQLRDLHRHLCDTFATREVIPAYLRTPLRMFGGRTPHDILLAGRIDQVEGELEALDSGIFS